MDNIDIPQTNKEKSRLGSLRIVSAPKEDKTRYRFLDEEREELEDTSNNLAFPFHDDEEASEETDLQYSEKKKEAEVRIERAKKSKYSRERTVKLVGIAVTAIWLGLAIGYYIRSFDQIGVLFMMPPHIVGISITGLVAPVILLWFTIGQFFKGPRQSHAQDIKEKSHRNPHKDLP